MKNLGDTFEYEFDVSVVICTYNRCDMLPQALESVLAQETGGVRYELIVVDNNSQDGTREVVEAFLRYGYSNMRYIFEGKQGLPHARNTGMMYARAPIIAFTDDDVRVTKDWVKRIKQAFDEHPEVDLVGGKVLPNWKRKPPEWMMTPKLWGPLALQDYGETPFLTNGQQPVCLIGANMSLRREVFARIGYFAVEFVRLGVSSTEDHELQLRLWRAGRQGIYLPEIVVIADVQAERLTKTYHRLWHTGHGKSSAIMRLDEMFTTEGQLTERLSDDVITLFGVPAFIYHDLLGASFQWLNAALRGREGIALLNENWVRRRISYIRYTYEIERVKHKQNPLTEFGVFSTRLLRKKLLTLLAKK